MTHTKLCTSHVVFNWLFCLRWKNLQLAMDDRYKQIRDTPKSTINNSNGTSPASHSEASTSLLLSGSVDLPWKRETTPNKVPFYIK